MKQTLVLIPGVSGDSGLWQHQINHLQEVVDIKVIVVTQRTTCQDMIDYVLEQSQQSILTGAKTLIIHGNQEPLFSLEEPADVVDLSVVKGRNQ
ncbi:TPA: hypothetical protein ACPSKB_002154 [Legionella feeleii]|uniref:Uncharacterized protein n=1 Tax=Legionella feeleii TaxID=453 RepID=A0A378IQ97_9GAMM|nr:hypothetical protein [Legionella feeleii]STX37120.1 Uncharacterised protein [Legionella feeleii]